MNQEFFTSWGKNNNIKIIEANGIKKVLLNKQTYMKWDVDDLASQRMAIVQLYQTGLSTQESLAQLFSIHINSVQKYNSGYTKYGLIGLTSRERGPKGKLETDSTITGKNINNCIERRDHKI